MPISYYFLQLLHVFGENLPKKLYNDQFLKDCYNATPFRE